MGVANLRLALLPPGNSGTGASEADEEIHSVNTSSGIIFNSQIDVLVNSESEVTGSGEIPGKELVFLHLKSTLDNLKRFFTTDSHVDSDLLVTTNSEGTQCVSRYMVIWNNNNLRMCKLLS